MSEVKCLKKLFRILAAQNIIITQKRIFDLIELNKEYLVEKERTIGCRTYKK